MAQRIASLAITKTMASRIRPAMMEMVVDDMMTRLEAGTARRRYSNDQIVRMLNRRAVPASQQTALLFFVVSSDDRLNISAHVEVAFNLHAQWIARLNEILEDDVDNMLVKDLHFPK
jgi:hypothetical protein